MDPMTPRRSVLALLALVPATTLTGCFFGGRGQRSEPPPTADYEPIPDEQLFEQIRALDGVAGAGILHRDDRTHGNSYAGHITLEQGVTKDEAVAIVDHAYAILRQGEYRAAIILTSGSAPGVEPVVATSVSDLPIRGRHAAALEERYGPQPGDGTPPGDLPASSE